MGREDGEVGDPEGQGLAGEQRRGRRGGLEAHGQKHHLPLGMGTGDLQGLQRRRDQPHIGAGGAGLEQACAAATGHPQHVAVGGEDHPRLQGQGDGGIEAVGRGDAHRTARAMDQMQIGGQQLIEPPAQDCVGLAATHLHQGPGTGGGRGELRGQRLHGRRAAGWLERRPTG